MDTLATDDLDKLLTNYQTCLLIDLVCSFSVVQGHGRELHGRTPGGSRRRSDRRGRYAGRGIGGCRVSG